MWTIDSTTGQRTLVAVLVGGIVTVLGRGPSVAVQLEPDVVQLLDEWMNNTACGAVHLPPADSVADSGGGRK